MLPKRLVVRESAIPAGTHCFVTQQGGVWEFISVENCEYQPVFVFTTPWSLRSGDVLQFSCHGGKFAVTNQELRHQHNMQYDTAPTCMLEMEIEQLKNRISRKKDELFELQRDYQLPHSNTQ